MQSEEHSPEAQTLGIESEATLGFTKASNVAASHSQVPSRAWQVFTTTVLFDFYLMQIGS